MIKFVCYSLFIVVFIVVLPFYGLFMSWALIFGWVAKTFQACAKLADEAVYILIQGVDWLERRLGRIIDRP